MAIIGWKLDIQERTRLLEIFPPAWPHVIADHVTLGTSDSVKIELHSEVKALIVGEADDGIGLQALVVAINGTHERPDGGTFHITWSLDSNAGRRPVESNEVLAKIGWHLLVSSIPVCVMPSLL